MAKKKEMFAVIGLGRFGRAVARQLYDMNFEVLAIDTDEHNVDEISNFVTYAVCCDAKNEASLRAAGIDGCSCVIVAIGADITDSVLTTLTLKEMGIQKIVCKANDVNHKKVLEKIGADLVMIPEYEMGIKLATRLVSSDILDFIELSKEFGIADIRVPSSWVGKPIKEIDVRKKYGINIVAIKTQKNTEMLPDADYLFMENDDVVVVGKYESINMLGTIE